MATTLGRVVTHNEELSLIKLHDPSNAWFFEIIGQFKYFISSFAPDQWLPNMAMCQQCGQQMP